jgi:AcrR family transcriptional regulator
MDAVATKPVATRGMVTRGALLDAAEALIAEHGYRTPSHRMIASAASTHVALINYHFSNKEMLFEAAVERRAGRLRDAWREALAAMRAQAAPTVADVFAAWWAPFADHETDPRWGNYLCIVARLGAAASGEAWHQRHFGAADREFHDALAATLPGARREDVEAGFRYARVLFGEVLLVRCGKSGGPARAPGFREEDIGRLIRFASAGLRGLTRSLAIAAD